MFINRPFFWFIFLTCYLLHFALSENTNEQPLNVIINSDIKSHNYSMLKVFDINNVKKQQSFNLQKPNKNIKYVNKLNLKEANFAVSTTPVDIGNWECPIVNQTKNLECGCDLKYTLRCSGDIRSLDLIATNLRDAKYSVSLLDCTLKNVTILSEPRVFENISLHGLVISSGEIKRLHRTFFEGINSPGLSELGLPNNALSSVPGESLQTLTYLDRLDLSNNKIKMISASDFSNLQHLTYLDLMDNQISSINARAFVSLQKLSILKLSNNRLGDVVSSIQAIRKCPNLRELDLRGNNIRGPLEASILPVLKYLRILNLDRNVISSIKTGTFINYSNLVLLSLRQCQIDVLQDKAFDGLNALQELDLSHNGIVSITSLISLPRLLVLNLKHNFLRAVSAELISPLPFIQQLDLSDNDITTVHPNALKNVTTLKNFLLFNNPLNCDCNLRNLKEFSISSKILFGAVCQTPPRLEGAPLLQIPAQALTCDEEQEAPDAINSISNQLNNSFLNYNQNFHSLIDSSQNIRLEEVHLSLDYGLLMMWNIENPIKNFKCNTLFVFERVESRNIIRNSSPVNCQYSHSSRANSFTILIPEGFDFTRGELYKFCLTLNNLEISNFEELLYGCSDYVDVSKDIKIQHNTINTSKINPLQIVDLSNSTDISAFDKISEHSMINTYKQQLTTSQESLSDEEISEIIDDDLKTKRKVLIALGVCILLASVGICIIALFKLHSLQRRRHITTNVCNSIDSEYVKLETVTSL
uniref:CSON006892 protein n=1 Tax=Culicoides sonorensis TaxID=179676 RepID=A0A336LX41_CULSO